MYIVIVYVYTKSSCQMDGEVKRKTQKIMIKYMWEILGSVICLF